MKGDSRKSEIGLLYASSARCGDADAQGNAARGLGEAEQDYSRFKARLELVPADKVPDDRDSTRSR